MLVLHFSMQGEDIFELIDGKCHAFSFNTLRPKMSVLLLQKIGPKLIIRLLAQLEIEAPSQILLHKTFYIKNLVSQHRKFRGCSKVVVGFFYFESYTYNYPVNGQRALVSPELES